MEETRLGSTWLRLVVAAVAGSIALGRPAAEEAAAAEWVQEAAPATINLATALQDRDLMEAKATIMVVAAAAIP